MTDFKAIYSSRAVDYERLVSREDYQGNIPRALNEIRDFKGMEVVDLGAGTGRMTRLLAPIARHVHAMDISEHMLEVAAGRLRALGLENWNAVAADNRILPLKSDSVDAAVAGWSLGHTVGWRPDDWREEIGRALSEMDRVVKRGGAVIILETQGTGRKTPQAPVPELRDYYDWLQQTRGFSASWIRTDYRFASVAEARSLVSFFFGEEMAADIVRPDSDIVPECTGIWWRPAG